MSRWWKRLFGWRESSMPKMAVIVEQTETARQLEKAVVSEQVANRIALLQNKETTRKLIKDLLARADETPERQR